MPTNNRDGRISAGEAEKRTVGTYKLYLQTSQSRELENWLIGLFGKVTLSSKVAMTATRLGTVLDSGCMCIDYSKKLKASFEDWTIPVFAVIVVIYQEVHGWCSLLFYCKVCWLVARLLCMSTCMAPCLFLCIPKTI